MEIILGIVIVLLILSRQGQSASLGVSGSIALPNSQEMNLAAAVSLGSAGVTIQAALPPIKVPPITSLISPQGVNVGSIVASGIAAIAPATGPAAPLVEAGAGILSLLSKLFAGCGQSCINASKINQAFYAIVQNLNSLQIQSMLPFSVQIPIFQYLLQQAQGSFPGDSHGTAGLNLTIQTLQAAISFAQQHVASANYGGVPIPADLHNYYIRGSNYAGLQPQWAAGFAKAPSQGGQWYSDALDEADQLTDAVLSRFGWVPGSVAA